VAGLSRKVEDDLLIPDKVLEGKRVPHVRDIDGYVVSYLVHIPKVAAVLGQETVD
jgi:hypothetical protein